MATPKAHITWTATSLGAAFQAYYVQRYNETLLTSGVSTPGWQDIAKITSEATTAFDDYEGRRTVTEQWRVLVQDIYGIRSIAPSAVTATPSYGTYTLVSNEKPALNQDIAPLYPLKVALPERVVVAPVVGRYGQRLSRSTDRLGEVLDLQPLLTGTAGAPLWRTIVNNLRDATVSYLCLLDPWGGRWFAGLLPQAVNVEFMSFAELAAQLIEVTDTPSVVTV